VRENGHTSNPFGLVSAFVELFRRQGGEIVPARALGFRLDGKRLTEIATDRGDQPAERAVVCAGAYSKPLAASLGDKVPLETERGYHLMIRDPEIMPRIPTADADGKFVATPMDTGLRFAGTVELAGLDAPPDWRRSQILLPHVAGAGKGACRRADLDVDGAPAGDAGLAAGYRGVARLTGCDLRVWARPCRNDGGADDRKDRRRSRLGAAGLDRYRALRAEPFQLDHVRSV
jgi:hypothetical protein